jgi:CheY-like chemotaxis protein
LLLFVGELVHITAIDDDPVTLRALTHFLEVAGHAVTGFTDPVEGLEALEGALPDLVITDLSMPECSGFAVIRALRARPESRCLPIVVLSARSETSDFHESFVVGADDYLRKPICPSELVAKCERLVMGRGATTPLVSQGEGTRTGEDLGGYRVRGTLARGAQGSVYLVEDEDGRTWALKTLARPPDQKREVELRFMREVYSLAALDHPQIVRLHAPRSSHDGFWYLMDFIEGPTVKVAIRQSQPGLAELLAFLEAVLKALAVMQEARLVHRDLKPSNVILRAGRWEDPVLVDFGLAKFVWDASVTSPEIALGTPGYVAPELLDAGSSATSATDLFSLGVVACEAGHGYHPFADRFGLELADHMASTPVPTPEDWPDELSDVVRDMTRIDPAARPSIAEVLERLGRVPAP